MLTLVWGAAGFVLALSILLVASTELAFLAMALAVLSLVVVVIRDQDPRFRSSAIGAWVAALGALVIWAVRIVGPR